jgi:hypothetical protein
LFEPLDEVILIPPKALSTNAGQRRVHNGKQWLAEIREQGYGSGETIVYDYLRALRERPHGLEADQLSKKRAVHSTSQPTLSARAAAWVFVCNPQKLRLPQVLSLDHLRVVDEELGRA